MSTDQIIYCNEETAEKFLDWIRTRGGVAHWRSADLSDPGKTWSAPYLDETGQPKGRQHWKMEVQPAYVVTDPAEVVVETHVEHKRFRVAIRRGDSFNFTLTDASSRKLRAAMDKAGDKASYHFDYDTQEAVITLPSRSITLAEWAKERGL